MEMYREIFATSYIAMSVTVMYFVAPRDERKFSSYFLAACLGLTGIAAFFVPEGILFATLWATLLIQPSFAIILLMLLEPKRMQVPMIVGILVAALSFYAGSDLIDGISWAILSFLYVTLASWFALRNVKWTPILALYLPLVALSKLTGISAFTITIEVLSLLMAYLSLCLKALEGSGFEREYKRFELKRKAFHFAAFIAVIPIFVDVSPFIEAAVNGLKGFNKELALELLEMSPVNVGAIVIFGAAIPMFILIESVRIIAGVSLIPGNLLRKAEKRSFASYLFSMEAILLAAMLFNTEILIASVLVGLLADAMAAIIGVKFGKHKITKNRSLEGTVAGFLTTFLILLPFISPLKAAVISLALSLFDAFNVKDINDNLVFPLMTASLLAVL